MTDERIEQIRSWWLDDYCGKHDGYHLQNWEGGAAYVFKNADDEIPLQVINDLQDRIDALLIAAKAAADAIPLLTSELSGQVGYIEGLGAPAHGRPETAIEHAYTALNAIRGALVPSELAPSQEKS